MYLREIKMLGMESLRMLIISSIIIQFGFLLCTLLWFYPYDGNGVFVWPLVGVLSLSISYAIFLFITIENKKQFGNLYFGINMLIISILILVLLIALSDFGNKYVSLIVVSIYSFVLLFTEIFLLKKNIINFWKNSSNSGRGSRGGVIGLAIGNALYLGFLKESESYIRDFVGFSLGTMFMFICGLCGLLYMNKYLLYKSNPNMMIVYIDNK